MRLFLSFVVLGRLILAAESAPSIAGPAIRSIVPAIGEIAPVAGETLAGPTNTSFHLITEREIENAIRTTLGQGQPEISLEITAHSRDLLPEGEADFPLSNVNKPSPLHPKAAMLWRGYWRTADGRSIPIWARVSALRPRFVIRLREDVQAGAVLLPSVLEQVTVLDSALLPSQPETRDAYEGKILRRFAKAGSLLSAERVKDPPLVLRNSMVPVDVSSGNLHLLLKARAEADGQSGESIRLTIPGGHRQFVATIQPDGSALLNVAVNGPIVHGFTREKIGAL